ncbi:ketoreductase [Plectosphaerella cucumerina]|uniref:Ketoreductase n=1 Tax=Plectosphaerella cucumerina TaxID=40658 RepID=A0A8K0X5I7_9PEZI|nr:ketoreductase [Plectosphaerella cucumerina]
MASASSPTVLVTGINGYIASATVLEFIAAGYRVRGTVRSLDKSQAILSEAFRAHLDANTLEIVEVPDALAPKALDDAVKGVVGVAHIASPGMSAKDLADPVGAIHNARDGTTNVLCSIEAHAGPQLRGVVLVSSVATIMAMDSPPGYRYTGDEFNESYIDMTIALGKESPVPLRYTAVKVAVEKAFWDFFKRTDRPAPAFTGVSVNPSFVIGPVAVRPEDPTSLPLSVRSIWHILGGGAWPAEFPTPAFVDVRDVGRACVLGVERGELTNGRRLLLSAYRGSCQAVADILHEELPERKDKIRAGTPGARSPDDVSWGDDEVGMDGSRFEEISGVKYRSYRESVVASARSMEPYIAAGKDQELGDEVPRMF